MTIAEFDANVQRHKSDGKLGSDSHPRDSRSTPIAMQHTHQLEAIREIVSRTFAEYTSDDVEFSESVLIRDGFYCGRRFISDSIRAVWFAEDNVIKFYGKDGAFLMSHRADDSPRRERRQAA